MTSKFEGKTLINVLDFKSILISVDKIKNFTGISHRLEEARSNFVLKLSKQKKNYLIESIAELQYRLE